MTKPTIDVDTARKTMEALDLMFFEMENNGLASVINELAAVQHEIWSHWMKYMFEQGIQEHIQTDEGLVHGDWIMPDDKATRWHRQMNTPYLELSPKERESDIEQAIKVINALEAWYKKSESSLYERAAKWVDDSRGT